MTTAVANQVYSEHRLERAICARSFPAFLERVRIQEPPSPSEPLSGGVIPFEPWPHLVDLASILPMTWLLALLKARQDGATWLVAAYLDWLSNYRAGTDGLLLSKTEPDAWAFLSKVQTVHRLLPQHLVTPYSKEPTNEVLAYRNGSVMTAMASTENAGRSRTFSVVVQDEADYHPYLAENYAAVKPTIDAGGQLIMVSTVNKRKMDTLFKGIVRGAPGNGWTKRFWGWRLRPGRDDAWYARTKAAVPATIGMTPELYMEQEYPGSEAEALAPSRAMAFFDQDALVAMQDDCKEPTMLKGGLVRVWRKPVVAVKYIGFGDVCWGHQGAHSCFVLADWQTGEQVAEIYGRPEHDEYAQAIANLTKEYNGAYFGIEANGEGGERSGLNVINKLVALGLGDRMYHHGKEWRDIESQRGFLTTGVTRPVMLGELEEAVRLRGIVPRCRDAVTEMMSFIRNEKSRPEAASGAFADHVMAWAGLWQMRKYARYTTPSTFRGTSRSMYA